LTSELGALEKRYKVTQAEGLALRRDMDSMASQALLLHSFVLQGMQVLREVVATEEEESMREQEGKSELEMERDRHETMRQNVEEERRLRNVALQTVYLFFF
jgi:hypothetical protein